MDWFCAPRFDSPACFAALLGELKHGRWLIAPTHEPRRITRSYRGDSLVLETVFETESGCVALIDCLPLSADQDDPQIVRVVEGRSGSVEMRLEIVIRFGYGRIVPWVTRQPTGIRATAGPDRLHLYSEVPLHGENMHTSAEFRVQRGEIVPFILGYQASHLPERPPPAPWYVVQSTEATWGSWSKRSRYSGEFKSAVQRSLCVLKALTYRPAGGIVAAATTSLPERLGGTRNWD